MLDYITGKITELTPASVVIEAGGLGYYASISLNTYSALNGLTDCKLYVYESIREDAHQLFGFIEKRERELFLHLITVSGVGANTARMVLSSITVSDLENVIASGNSSALKAVKGIGNKTAERIIIDLKDKIKITGTASGSLPGRTSPLAEEAVAALAALGFNQAASQKVVARICGDRPTAKVEEIIKTALKML
ncbi:MAG: Holliday junction branch migration protein RuvA [Dysgonamonadaceae bacterium]|jgi:Holliday junction DNA helicase RuvA|nr:Holliday junction branch migration protein RuvA [Dysgonamonadaceae bacterium]